MIRRIITRWRGLRWWGKMLVGGMGLGLAALVSLVGLYVYSRSQSNSPEYIGRWFNDAEARDELTTERMEPCPGAPFLLPSTGLIGLLWADPAGPYNILQRHTGVDIFGDGPEGTVPVFAAYDGYLTRLDDWVSAVIIQHDDPLQPGRAIWTYYTHMASVGGNSYISDLFPQGTRGRFVAQGDFLGYQGTYNGGSVRGIGMHLHFSIVLSEDDGSFRNEAVLSNTLDPSPYFGMEMNINELPTRPIGCARQP
jgi:peptidoglycan LD-endopeptidase LytH